MFRDSILSAYCLSWVYLAYYSKSCVPFFEAAETAPDDRVNDRGNLRLALYEMLCGRPIDSLGGLAGAGV